MNINISLNQGKKFNNYQSRIKKSIEKGDPLFNPKQYTNKSSNQPFKSFKEGFINVFDENAKDVAAANTSNSNESNELQQLKSQFDSLVKQYTDAQSSSSNSMNQLLARYDSNPYAGKNVNLTGPGAIGYVTGLGDYKWYGNPDIFTNTSGKNGCPLQSEVTNIDITTDLYNVPGSTINSNPTLLVGKPIVSGQSCGNEGKNVYVNKLINNPTSTYIGCYNDKPAPTQTNIVPIMNSSNAADGFTSGASSIYMNNNDMCGPWCAFDQNVNTFWHSEVADGFVYDAFTGLYLGNNSITYYGPSGPATVKGEWLQVSALNGAICTSYSIQGRQDCCGTPNGRDPNTWYVLGFNNTGDNAGWTQIDYQENQEFNYQEKTYTISNPAKYIAYIIIITVCGSSGDKTGNRYCVQIATWNLITSSDYSFTDSERAMIWNPSAIGYTSLNDCEQYAAENGYKYFGMQDVRTDGTAACLVSNDLDKSKSYGDASIIVTGTPLWSSNTSGNNYASVTTDGRLVVVNQSTGVTSWMANDSPADCVLGGKINPDGLTATYGASCNNSGYNVPMNNESDIVINEIKNNNYPVTLPIPVNNSFFGDPAVGCIKSWDTYYKCGNKDKTGHIDYAEGQTFIYDCTAESASCKFFLTLQGDGNLCLYRGTSPMDNQGVIWCSQTNGKQMDPNPEWVSSKGKTGVNYLISDQTLYPNEWIGSDDGSLKLMMQTDGNLVLYTSSSKPGCSSGTDGKQYGGSWVNAIYQLDTTGNPASMGKVGYVDSDTNLKEYPSSTIGRAQDYDIYAGYDSAGNDINIFQSNDMAGCQTACNSDSNCFGYVWQPDYSTCYLKNNNIYPNGPRQANSTLTLGVRKPAISGTSCSDKMIGIDSVQYDNYIKGEAMTSDTICGGNITSDANQQVLSDLENQLADISQQISDKVNQLSTDSTNLNNTMSSNKTQMNDNLKMYYDVQTKMNTLLGKKNIKYKKTNKIMNNNMVEGMLSMQDIKAMVSDSDLIVLQNNYQYILWSILAIGIVCITIKTLRK
jgi:hypothetical protein